MHQVRWEEDNKWKKKYFIDSMKALSFAVKKRQYCEKVFIIDKTKKVDFVEAFKYK